MDWTMVGAVAATFYTISFIVAVWIAYIQLDRFEKGRKLEVILTIFKELETQELISSRIHLYRSFLEDIKNLSQEEIESHLQCGGPAIFSLDRIGYLIQKGHIEESLFIERYWSTVWKCWVKSSNLIVWVRQQRGESEFYQGFEQLFKRAEAHRIRYGYEKPKFF